MSKPGRVYVPLDITFFDGDGSDLSDEGQLLFLRMLARIKFLRSAGWLNATQLEKCGASVAYSIQELVKSPLVAEIDGRYYVPSWCEWDDPNNRSDDGKLGNHVRWHVKRGILEQECHLCRSETSIGGDSGAISGGDSDSDSQQNRTEQNRTHTRRTFGAEFARFWAIYPRRVGKGTASGAFDVAAAKFGVDVILAGAERVRDDPNRPEIKFIPHPTTWLRRQGWDDDPSPSEDTFDPYHYEPLRIEP